MKVSEIVRIIGFSVLAAFVMFFVQPWIYENKIIRISDVELEPWISQNYTVGSGLVFAGSVIATILWYFMAANAKVQGAGDVDRWRVLWWLCFLLPILSIIVALAFFNQSSQALVSLTGFYIIDITLAFWLPTATSSPGLLMYLPPGAFLLRRRLGG